MEATQTMIVGAKDKATSGATVMMHHHHYPGDGNGENGRQEYQSLLNAGDGGSGASVSAVSSSAAAAAAGGGGVSGAERKRPMKTLAIIAAWYTSNIGVILMNKFLLSTYNYKFPIFLTFLHMLSCSVCSFAAARTGVVDVQAVRSRSQYKKISVLATLFCLSVVGGNISLRYIPVSFNQAIGATTPFFTAIAAYLVQRKTESLATYLSLVPVVVGIVIASNSEPSFHMIGFTVCIASTCVRALKSVTQGLLLSSESEKMNSVNLLLYMAPIGAGILFVASLAMEPKAISETWTRCRNSLGFTTLIIVNMTLAYLVNLTNFLVTYYTSALTLQVLGNGKGVVGVLLSILIFRNPVTVTGMFGYAITVAGVVLYGESKKLKKTDRLQPSLSSSSKSSSSSAANTLAEMAAAKGGMATASKLSA